MMAIMFTFQEYRNSLKKLHKLGKTPEIWKFLRFMFHLIRQYLNQFALVGDNGNDKTRGDDTRNSYGSDMLEGVGLIVGSDTITLPSLPPTSKPGGATGSVGEPGGGGDGGETELFLCVVTRLPIRPPITPTNAKVEKSIKDFRRLSDTVFFFKTVSGTTIIS